MGGTTFDQYYEHPDVRQAFRGAQEVAGRDHGFGGYSGTIVEKPGYIVIQHQPLSMAAAQELADTLINDDDPRIRDKWGNAGAIPVVKVDPDTLREEEVTVRLPGGTNWQERQAALKAAVRPALGGRLKKDDEIITARELKVEPIKVLTEVVAPKGATKTRYVIRHGLGHNRWEDGFDTQAQARAWLTARLDDNAVNQFNDSAAYEIEAITRREDGSPLVRATQRVLMYQIQAAVQIIRHDPTKPARTTPDGWLFFGWASC